MQVKSTVMETSMEVNSKYQYCGRSPCCEKYIAFDQLFHVCIHTSGGHVYTVNVALTFESMLHSRPHIFFRLVGCVPFNEWNAAV